MPRSGRGGRREGTPGTAYANRTDLNAPPTATAGYMQGNVRPYDTAPEIPPASLPPGPGATGSAGPGAPQPSAPAVAPGQLGGLADPSGRPQEPLTAGLPVGAGAGPEALGAFAPGAQAQMDLFLLARYLPTLQALATSPSASRAAKNMVRQLKAMIPFDQYQQMKGGPRATEPPGGSSGGY